MLLHLVDDDNGDEEDDEDNNNMVGPTIHMFVGGRTWNVQPPFAMAAASSFRGSTTSRSMRFQRSAGPIQSIDRWRQSIVHNNNNNNNNDDIGGRTGEREVDHGRPVDGHQVVDQVAALLHNNNNNNNNDCVSHLSVIMIIILIIMMMMMMMII